MRSIWIKVAAALVAVWAIVGGIIFWASHSKPSPERLTRYLSEHPLDAKSGRDRERIMTDVASQMNGLTFEERREVRMGKKLDGFFRSLTPDEQSRFLDLTLPTGFKQMMESFNKMTAEQRKRFVDRTLDDMRKQEGTDARSPDDPHVQKMIEQGLNSFYTDASADVKMDFAPLIEQMQKNLQWGR